MQSPLPETNDPLPPELNRTLAFCRCSSHCGVGSNRYFSFNCLSGGLVRTAGRGLDWIKLRNFLAGPAMGRDLIEMVVYAGLPPATPAWQEERDKKNKFVHWLRSNGFMVVTKDGSPAEEGHYKANVDVMMAIDALELSIEMRPDVVILVTGDADFAYLANKLRRHGIRGEVAS